MKIHIVHRFDQLPAAIHNTLGQPAASPFFNSDFLHQLEACGCVSGHTGWYPHHLWIERDNVPVFFMPVYQKTHSWGEFVFDQRWAAFYQEHGRRYYPKLTTSIPFTPSVGARWWVADGENETDLLQMALQHLGAMLQKGEASSWHLLFADNLPSAARPAELLLRHDTQFHWQNEAYADFDDFLSRLKSRKRKKIRRERERVREQGVSLEICEGPVLTAEDWRQFYRCYSATYSARDQRPYLNEEFFQRLGAARPQQIMMVKALRDKRMVGAALCFHDDTTLYGRHWGALEDIDCLHFEACFYQGIEYCIRRGLSRFDPGTQGEHKLLRGFAPVQTASWHWIAHPQFRAAIAQYLDWERQETQRYYESAGEWLPFRSDTNDADNQDDSTSA